MNEIIKPLAFENAKNHIKLFSDGTSKVSICPVDTSWGLFDMFDHRVTGEEFNERIKIIQDCFIDVQKRHRDFTNEFGQVYLALESLDNEFMSKSIPVINRFEQAIQAIQANESDGKKRQKKFLEVLEEHQVKLDTILTNVNELELKLKNINITESKLSELEAFSKTLDKSLTAEKKRIGEVYLQEHILDIDKLWISFSENCNNVNELKYKLSTYTNYVNEIQKKYAESEAIYLSEIDSIKKNLTKSNILFLIVLFLFVIELVQKYLVVI
jgi:hypothetical protein